MPSSLGCRLLVTTLSLEKAALESCCDGCRQMLGCSLKHAAVVLVRVVCHWGTEGWLYKPQLLHSHHKLIYKSIYCIPQWCSLPRQPVPWRRALCKVETVVYKGCVKENLVLPGLLFCLFLPTRSNSSFPFQVLDLVGGWPGYRVEGSSEANCLRCYRWAGWEEMKTLFTGGGWKSSAIELQH